MIVAAPSEAAAWTLLATREGSERAAVVYPRHYRPAILDQGGVSGDVSISRH